MWRNSVRDPPFGAIKAPRLLWLLGGLALSIPIILWGLESFVLNVATLHVVNRSQEKIVSGQWTVASVDAPNHSKSIELGALAVGQQKTLRFRTLGDMRYDAKVSFASRRELSATESYVGGVPKLLPGDQGFDDAVDLIIADREISIQPSYPTR